MTRTFVVCTVGAFAGTPAAAQKAVAVVPLDRPDHVVAEPFSLLRGVRELPDGRVIVSDFIEDRIAIVNFAAGTVTDRNRPGPGPQEFRLPGALLRFAGDSTLLLDDGNARIDVLDGEGRIARSFRPSVPSAAAPAGVDARGRLFHAIPPWHASTPLGGDTVELAVWDPATDAGRTLTRLHGSTKPPPPKDPRDGRASRSSCSRSRMGGPLRPTDAWRSCAVRTTRCAGWMEIA